jgi:hypothetical protein
MCQNNCDTFDEAAYCYTVWLKNIGYFEVPGRFEEFLTKYAQDEHANFEIRRQFFDVIFAKCCAVWDGHSKSILTIFRKVVRASPLQREASLAMFRLASFAKAKGQNAENLSILIAILMLRSSLDISVEYIQYASIWYGKDDWFWEDLIPITVQLGSGLIKSTIQEQRRGRQRPSSCEPACHSGWRCA